ncbi:hypothetical protein [Anaerocolumna xylanovorans]|uniref:hypothetical protein n=1 Tax=Anaerocolumna xylanovorans TaxID=100134 RepID=UPI001FA83AF6|nr:hypothetical protein [Anaerocolumna xylanovorans]
MAVIGGGFGSPLLLESPRVRLLPGNCTSKKLWRGGCLYVKSDAGKDKLSSNINLGSVSSKNHDSTPS